MLMIVMFWLFNLSATRDPFCINQTQYYSRIISSIVSKWLYSYVIHTLSEQLHYCNNCIRNTNRPFRIVYNTLEPMVKSGHNCWTEDWDSWPPDVVFRKLDYHIGSSRSILINNDQYKIKLLIKIIEHIKLT